MPKRGRARIGRLVRRKRTRNASQQSPLDVDDQKKGQQSAAHPQKENEGISTDVTLGQHSSSTVSGTPAMSQRGKRPFLAARSKIASRHLKQAHLVRRNPSTLASKKKQMMAVTAKAMSGSEKDKKMQTRLSTGTLIMSGTSTASSTPTSDKSNFPETSALTSSSAASPGTTPAASLKRKFLGTDGNDNLPPPVPPKKRKIGRNDGSGKDNKNDYFCWLCHREGKLICCELCPRVFHIKCLTTNNNIDQDWVCPECEKIMQAECTDTRSEAMASISIETLCQLLGFVLDRMKAVGARTFEKPLDPSVFLNYSDYVFHPMCLSQIEKNLRRKMYGSTEAFLADVKWIVHNSIVYNGVQSEITTAAKSLLKVCKHELNEIEVCPDCYMSSCVQNHPDWFCEPCPKPHPLVWAKLKGYPFWPSKVLREVKGQVDVRFFGAHDRSWVPITSCFMWSIETPSIYKKTRSGIEVAVKEVRLHIKKIREKFGNFEYLPFQTPYSKANALKQLNPNAPRKSQLKPAMQSPGNSNQPLKRLSVALDAGGNFQTLAATTIAPPLATIAPPLATSATPLATSAPPQPISRQPAAVPAARIPSRVAASPMLKQALVATSTVSGTAKTTSETAHSKGKQVIYLKPMQKGVFLLSQTSAQQLSPLQPVKAGVSRPSVPGKSEDSGPSVPRLYGCYLQLVKRVETQINSTKVFRASLPTMPLSSASPAILSPTPSPPASSSIPPSSSLTSSSSSIAMNSPSLSRGPGQSKDDAGSSANTATGALILMPKLTKGVPDTFATTMEGSTLVVPTPIPKEDVISSGTPPDDSTNEQQKFIEIPQTSSDKRMGDANDVAMIDKADPKADGSKSDAQPASQSPGNMQEKLTATPHQRASSSKPSDSVDVQRESGNFSKQIDEEMGEEAPLDDEPDVLPLDDKESGGQEDGKEKSHESDENDKKETARNDQKEGLEDHEKKTIEKASTVEKESAREKVSSHEDDKEGKSMDSDSDANSSLVIADVEPTPPAEEPAEKGGGESSDAPSSSMKSALSIDPTVTTESPASGGKVSPGSAYVAGLQKVIDSCKAKLGLEDGDIIALDNDGDEGLLGDSDSEDELHLALEVDEDDEKKIGGEKEKGSQEPKKPQSCSHEDSSSMSSEKKSLNTSSPPQSEFDGIQTDSLSRGSDDQSPMASGKGSGQCEDRRSNQDATSEDVERKKCAPLNDTSKSFQTSFQNQSVDPKDFNTMESSSNKAAVIRDQDTSLMEESPEADEGMSTELTKCTNGAQSTKDTESCHPEHFNQDKCQSSVTQQKMSPSGVQDSSETLSRSILQVESAAGQVVVSKSDANEISKTDLNTKDTPNVAIVSEHLSSHETEDMPSIAVASEQLPSHGTENMPSVAIASEQLSSHETEDTPSVAIASEQLPSHETENMPSVAVASEQLSSHEKEAREAVVAQKDSDVSSPSLEQVENNVKNASQHPAGKPSTCDLEKGSENEDDDDIGLDMEVNCEEDELLLDEDDYDTNNNDDDVEMIVISSNKRKDKLGLEGGHSDLSETLTGKRTLESSETLTFDAAFVDVPETPTEGTQTERTLPVSLSALLKSKAISNKTITSTATSEASTDPFTILKGQLLLPIPEGQKKSPTDTTVLHPPSIVFDMTSSAHSSESHALSLPLSASSEPPLTVVHGSSSSSSSSSPSLRDPDAVISLEDEDMDFENEGRVCDGNREGIGSGGDDDDDSGGSDVIIQGDEPCIDLDNAEESNERETTTTRLDEASKQTSGGAQIRIRVLSGSSERDTTSSLEVPHENSQRLERKLECLFQDKSSKITTWLSDQLEELRANAEDLVAKEKSTFALRGQASNEDVRKLQQENKLMKDKLADWKTLYDRTMLELKEAYQQESKTELASAKREAQQHLEAEIEKVKKELRKEHAASLQKSVAEIKKKQWCAECWKEAVYYCCWNTSYCGYQCQQKHWPSHLPTCMQAQHQKSSESVPVSSAPISKISLCKNVTVIRTSATATNSVSAPPGIRIIKSGSLPSSAQSKVSVVPASQWHMAGKDDMAKQQMVSAMASQSSTSLAASSKTSFSPLPSTGNVVGNSLQIFPSASNIQASPPNTNLTFAPGQQLQPTVQIQYLPQASATQQPLQLVGGANPSLPLMVPPLMAGGQSLANVQLLQNASVFPMIPQPQQTSPQPGQPAQQPMTGGFILPGSFGGLLRSTRPL